RAGRGRGSAGSAAPSPTGLEPATGPRFPAGLRRALALFFPSELIVQGGARPLPSPILRRKVALRCKSYTVRGRRRMKAYFLRAYGSSANLELTELDKPVPAENEVLVRVRATSVNPYDWHYMRGEPIIARFMPGTVSPRG